MFFGFKNSLLISTAIPLSMFIGFIVLSTFGITLNIVVLFSLVLVLGIVVDDAIVVIENAYRHQAELGAAPAQAAKDAAGEVFVPVLTSTVTTLSAFFPLLFWPDIVGEFMKFLPLTLIITLTASLFVAYVISPVQAAQWINYRKEIAKAKRDLEHPHWYKKYNPLTFLYHEVDTKLFPWLQGQYVQTLAWTMGETPFTRFRIRGREVAVSRRGFTIFAANLLLILSFIAFGFLNNGVEFFPNTEPNQVTVTIEAPPGTSLDVTNAIAEIVEQRIAAIPGRKDVEFVVANVGTSDDPFDFGGQGTPNKAQVAINFFQKAERGQSTFATLEEVRQGTTGIPGSDIRVQKQQMGPPVGAPVSIEISGEDYGQLAQLTRKVRGMIKDVPGVVDLKDDYSVGRPELDIIIDRERAGLFWSSTGQIASTIRAAISGVEASKYRIGEDEYKIRVRLREDQRLSPDDLENLRLNFMNRRGQQLSIPISSVARIERTEGVSDIRRKDQKRVITVSGEVEGRVQSEVLAEIKARLRGLDLPPRYGIKFSGSEEKQNESSAFLQRAFLITLMLVFLIMVMEFNSMKIPFVIMLSVLLSLIGVMFGLIITRTPFSIMMTGVGVVALAGIVVRNGIVLLDFVKHNRAEGHMTLEKALMEAGRVRLRPVLLTAGATVLGIMPLATGIDFDWRAGHFVFGAESAAFWRPMGVAIIFGLTISTFLTLIVVPTAYAFLEYWTARVGGMIRGVLRGESSGS
jgi:multidrug efflux pump subunit AcrB